MRRPNPWVAVPVLLATVGGGVVGGLITQLSCAPGSCIAASVAVGVVSAVLFGIGVGVVVVLALRSIAEWRTAEAAGRQRRPPADPGPPTC
jgi:uncharacterized membrane protein